MIPNPRQIGDSDGGGDGPPIPGKSGMGPPSPSPDKSGPPSPSPDKSGTWTGMGIGGSAPCLRRSCELSHARVSQSGFYSAYVRRMRREIYLTTQVYDTSLATCIRQSVYTTFLRACRSCPREACAWEIRNCCTPRNFRRHCIQK